MESPDEVVREVQSSPNNLATLNASEIDQQIATAHRFPRSIKQFRNEALQMVTLTESIAAECIYALPRDGKVIEGPSARFAEIVASAWGNCRAGARVVSDQGDFVTAQGVFHDLERNVAITFEVQRRIVNKEGRRFKTDMIGVTGNAASSIALRNAILKGIPKAFWSDMYAAARKTAAGDFKTLANRRSEAMKAFVIFGVKPEQIFAVLGVKGEEDIGIEHLVTLKGMLTALQEGDSTPEQMFASDKAGEGIARPQSKSAQASNAAPAQPAAPVAADGDKPQVQDGPLNENLIPVIKAKLEAAALSSVDLFKHFTKVKGHAVEKFEDLKVSDLESITEWIKNPC